MTLDQAEQRTTEVLADAQDILRTEFGPNPTSIECTLALRRAIVIALLGVREGRTSSRGAAGGPGSS